MNENPAVELAYQAGAEAMREACAVRLEKSAETGFNYPEYSMSQHDCMVARCHYRMAAAEVRALDVETLK